MSNLAFVEALRVSNNLARQNITSNNMNNEVPFMVVLKGIFGGSFNNSLRKQNYFSR